MISKRTDILHKKLSPKLQKCADKRKQHTLSNTTSMYCSNWDQVVWAAGLVCSMWQNLSYSKCKYPTLRTCLDIFSCTLAEVCLCVSNPGPFSLKVLSTCGARLMTEAAEYPATLSVPQLSGLQPFLQAVWRVLMYPEAQLCSPAKTRCTGH